MLAAGDVERGKATLEQLIEEKPDYPLAAMHLARLYLLDGKTERAARVIKGAKGLADQPAGERMAALIDALQGVKAPADEFAHLPLSQEAATSSSADPFNRNAEITGPHLALFTIAVHADHRSYMKKVLLLDPVSDFGNDVLKLTYNRIRNEGLNGLITAANADQQADIYIRSGLAIYETDERKVYNLVIGRFWNELPRDLSR